MTEFIKTLLNPQYMFGVVTIAGSIIVYVISKYMDYKIVQEKKKIFEIMGEQITEKQNVIEQLKEEKEEISSYDTYMKELDINIDIICEYKGKSDNTKLTKDLEEIIGSLRQIRKYTDETEYNQGQLKKLNSYYLPELKNLLKAYFNLAGCNIKNKKVTETKNEMVNFMHEIVLAFSNLALESVQKELTDASIDAKVFKNVAAANGLLYQEGLHF